MEKFNDINIIIQYLWDCGMKSQFFRREMNQLIDKHAVYDPKKITINDLYIKEK